MIGYFTKMGVLSQGDTANNNHGGTTLISAVGNFQSGTASVDMATANYVNTNNRCVVVVFNLCSARCAVATATITFKEDSTTLSTNAYGAGSGIRLQESFFRQPGANATYKNVYSGSAAGTQLYVCAQVGLMEVTI